MRIIFVLLAFIATAQAQAVSYIGLCNKSWPCSRTLETWKGKPIVTGWLEDSFGKNCKCANAILRQKKEKTIRVHLANGPCLRNKRCERHDVFYGYSIASANRAAKNPKSRLRKRLNVLANKLKQRIEQSKGPLTCYVSPCLECDLNGPARKALISAVSATLSNCSIVDNPLGGRCLRGTICERHGIAPKLHKPCIADLDGTEVKSKIDLQRFKQNTKQCDLSFYWTAWMNCNRKGSPIPFLKPSERDCSHPVLLFRKVRNLWN